MVLSGPALGAGKTVLAKGTMAMDVGADHIADVRAGADTSRSGRARRRWSRRRLRLLDHSADLLSELDSLDLGDREDAVVVVE